MGHSWHLSFFIGTKVYRRIVSSFLKKKVLKLLNFLIVLCCCNYDLSLFYFICLFFLNSTVSLHNDFICFVLQTPLYRRLWGQTRHVETLLPDANPRSFHSGYFPFGSWTESFDDLWLFFKEFLFTVTWNHSWPCLTLNCVSHFVCNLVCVCVCNRTSGKNKRFCFC